MQSLSWFYKEIVCEKKYDWASFHKCINRRQQEYSTIHWQITDNTKVNNCIKNNYVISALFCWSDQRSNWQHRHLFLVAGFFKRAGRCQQGLPPSQNCPVFVHARPNRPSCAGALPQELCHRFCCQILRLSSGIALALRDWLSDYQQGLKLGLKLELCCLTNGL